MKLSISNIAWAKEHDNEMYRFLQQEGIQGLEIAPTRIFPDAPYEHLPQAALWAQELQNTYDLSISSMQSIWFKRSENIFRSAQERQALLNYTKQAIDFASAIHCNNLVFGCPRNRSMDEHAKRSDAISFFHELGEYALSRNTVLALEPNPPIYNTNFINTTAEAIAMIQEVSSQGFLLNLDLGTMIYNEESLDIVAENLACINHIHISEPGLALITHRDLHRDLAAVISSQYPNYVSVEMGLQNDLSQIKDTI